MSLPHKSKPSPAEGEGLDDFARLREQLSEWAEGLRLLPATGCGPSLRTDYGTTDKAGGDDAAEAAGV